MIAVLVYVVTYIIVATAILAPTFVWLVYVFDRDMISGQAARLATLASGAMAVIVGQLAAIYMLGVAW